MEKESLIQSKVFWGILAGLLVLALMFLSFQMGQMVGFRKAKFSLDWGNNYHRNFGGPPRGFMNEMEGPEFMPGSGTFGQIIKIDGNNLLIRDKDGTERSLLLHEETSIRKFRDDIKSSDLKIDDLVVVIGSPSSSGQIEAKFIRVLPQPPTTTPKK